MPRAKQRNQSETRIPRSGRDLDGVVWGVFPPVISEPRSSQPFHCPVVFPFLFWPAKGSSARLPASQPPAGTQHGRRPVMTCVYSKSHGSRLHLSARPCPVSSIRRSQPTACGLMDGSVRYPMDKARVGWE
jgi:hypothetical protein